jgi:predicted transcriptional regulator
VVSVTDSSPAAAVERRLDALRALEVAPDSKAGLAERLGVSRSTADRSVRELKTHGFVASADAGHRTTVAGRLALDAHDRGTRRVDAAATVAPLFGGVTLSFDVEPAVLDGAQVVEAHPHAPNRPVRRVIALISDATHVSVYAGRFLSRQSRLYYDRVLDGMTGTFVATERVIERQRSTRPEDMWEAIDLGRIGVRRLDRDDPVSLVLAETPEGPEMGLVVYRDETPRGFVGNDHPAATRWARDLHERLWGAATPIDRPD